MASEPAPCNVWLVGQETPSVQRRGRYSTASVKEHTGKMLPALARRLIETYTAPGVRILDPMSGIGTVGVEAIILGREYVGMELEPRFVDLQLENLESARRRGATGSFVLRRSDARHLDPAFPSPDSDVLDPLGPFDAIFTSPPYGGRLENPRKVPPASFLRLVGAGKMGSTAMPIPSLLSHENLGNLKDDADYFAGIRHVYAGCYRLLKPGGLMALCVRFGRERERLRPLHHETARLCREVGFVFVDEIAAILARVDVLPGRQARVVGHPSFGHRRAIAHLRRRGYPVSLNQVEYVLLFRKPEPVATPGESPLKTKAAVGPPLPALSLRF